MDFLRNKCFSKQLLLIFLFCGVIYLIISRTQCSDTDLATITSSRDSDGSKDVYDSNSRYIRSLNCTTQSDREYEVDERKRFPSAIIIGVKKGGTRALLNMLEAHPDIVSAHREIHYFDYEENFRRGVEFYIDQMPISQPGQITIEKSPHYFVTEYVHRGWQWYHQI